MRLHALVLALPLLACTSNPSLAAKAQEVATELNMNLRFGRTEMAVEKVAQKERESWTKRHQAWGGAIRIADSELGGVRVPTPTEAEVTVKIAWYRVDEDELRQTTIRQKYKDVNGEWKLVGEARADGDYGLIGDPVPPAPASTKPPNVNPARYQTIRIGGAED